MLIFLIITTILSISALIYIFLLWSRTRDEISALRKENKEFSNLCNLIEAPIWFKDKDLRFTRVNDFYASMFGRDKAFFKGLRDQDIAPKKLVDGYVRDDKYVLESKKVYHYIENEKVGLWYKSTKFPLIDDNGTVQGLGGIAIDVTAKKKSEKLLQKLAHSDYITGLYNRVYLAVKATQELSYADESSTKLAFILVGIDDFSEISNQRGDVVGDEVLKIAAERLKDIVPENITTLGRFNDDEFMIILRDYSKEYNLNSLLEKIQNCLKEPFEIFKDKFTISVSFGISIYPDLGSDYETVIRKADLALKRAKENGPRSVVFYSDDIGNEDLERDSLERKLRNAIDKHELSLVYQPKFIGNAKTIAGIEALVRWKNKDLGSLEPNEFIPIAEESDLIVSIGDWVLRTALLQNLEWKKSTGVMYTMAINLSRNQILKPDFLSKVVNVLEELNYPPSALEFELRESLVSNVNQRVIDAFTKLRNMGVKISVDDFGTGFTNLLSLCTFPLDTLKIDRSFVSNITGSIKNQEIVNAIINLAKSFGLSLVAEVVETDQELEYVHKTGIDNVQGFYFAHPLNEDGMNEFFKDLLSGKFQSAQKS